MTKPPILPADFTDRIINTFGMEGIEWLRKFPQTLEQYRRHWSLRLLPHFEPLSYNFVAPALRQDGTEVVLKLGVPNNELRSEIKALRIYAGRGAARLYEADAESGALLIEHLRPGIPLVELGDDQKATEIAARIMPELWRPFSDPRGIAKLFEHSEKEDPWGLKTVEDWALGLKRLRQRYNGGTGPFPTNLVEKAEVLLAELIASTDTQVVLHGDLHHWNILSAQRQPWLTIDPKGVVGDPAFEVAAWMHNPTDELHTWPNLGRIQSRRLDQFSEILGLDRQRLLGWSLAQCVLSAWWCVEDNSSHFESTLATARVLSDLNPLTMKTFRREARK